MKPILLTSMLAAAVLATGGVGAQQSGIIINGGAIEAYSPVPGAGNGPIIINNDGAQAPGGGAVGMFGMSGMNGMNGFVGTFMQSQGNGNAASMAIGGMTSGGNVQGVTIINGQVFIDGTQIPPDVERYTSKSGQIYRIERSAGSVSVRTE